MAGFHRRTNVLAAGLIAVTVLVPTSVATEEQFQFVVSGRDADGRGLTDLKRDEIVMLENVVANDIVKVEPFHMPVKVTIAVDNGILSRDALAHYRSGLAGLVKALPPEIDVALLSMAPQPRFVVTSTLDRNRILRGISWSCLPRRRAQVLLPRGHVPHGPSFRTRRPNRSALSRHPRAAARPS